MLALLVPLFLIATITAAVADASDQPKGPPGSVRPVVIGDHSCKWPAIDRDAHSAPDTLVAFIITKTGTTKFISIVRSNGIPAMDQVAIQCAARYKYQPATLNGQPIEYPWRAKVAWLLGTPISVDKWPGLDETRAALRAQSTNQQTDKGQ